MLQFNFDPAEDSLANLKEIILRNHSQSNEIVTIVQQIESSLASIRTSFSKIQQLSIDSLTNTNHKAITPVIAQQINISAQI